ncbi:hypothetical protein [Paenibacillus alvei]|uniref:hypothetical protein n=1 Tax=Paenibacillus alvei TaxID=44250 RepID=UPI0013D9684A|nr:hypothetical protein [Paenibacillus alvei]
MQRNSEGTTSGYALPSLSRENGKLKAVIERCSFHEIPAAHQYADTDRIKGNVVITVGQG